jgi:hypothetical protein
VVARASFGWILARVSGVNSGVAHICLIHVNELTIHFSFRKKIHYQQVHIAIFEHMGQLLVEKSELLIVCIVCNLNHKHGQSPFGNLYLDEGQLICQRRFKWAS